MTFSIRTPLLLFLMFIPLISDKTFYVVTSAVDPGESPYLPSQRVPPPELARVTGNSLRRILLSAERPLTMIRFSPNKRHCSVTGIPVRRDSTRWPAATIPDRVCQYKEGLEPMIEADHNEAPFHQDDYHGGTGKWGCPGGSEGNTHMSRSTGGSTQAIAE